MTPEKERDKDLIVNAMADVFVENVISQRSFGIETDEVTAAFSKKMDELASMAPKKDDEP